MFSKIITKIFGDKSERDIKKILPIIDEINRIYEQLQSVPEEELRAKTAGFKQRIREERESIQAEHSDETPETVDELIFQREQEILNEILPEAFAIVKEACRRLIGKTWKVCDMPTTWDMIPFDVQLVGAVVLHQGKIAEMVTGEGKTLVATMPIYLNALTGRGVHLITVNDYLAKRDSEWMGKIYEMLGLTVGCIFHDMNSEQRKIEYGKDITYGTNNEFGFDYLRDNMSVHIDQLVQREHYYAIVDEVDSVLIDEARTPLIISGPVSVSTHQYKELKPLVERLVRQQTLLVNKIVGEAEQLLKDNKEYEAGIKLLQGNRGAPKNKRLTKLLNEVGTKKLMRRVENDYLRDKKMNEIDEDLYFTIDEKSNIIDLTENGRTNISLSLGDRYVLPYISQLLRAYSLFEKDVEYVVSDGKVIIVDEFTGRLMSGRRYSDGLHQAIEAKENVKIERETQTLATITLQNFFRLYRKLAGMTGTAMTEANEFYEIYKLDVVSIPTNKPVVRTDYDDQIYRTKREKYNAVIREIEEIKEQGRASLVGTISVDVSEVLSRMLKRRGIRHSVLNAKYHQQEAEIIANAGRAGTVTIATNMAGRGTDIKLGPGVVEQGGLHIIGTERHESRRIDLQLRGRSGRQGDPGSSRFFLSLEDDLMRLFGSERIAGVMDRIGVQEGEVIQHSMITRSIERAQKRVEMHNFDIRKHLLEYDNVMNQQREVIYDRRMHCLKGENLRDEVLFMIEKYVDNLINTHTDSKTYQEEWDWDGLKQNLIRVMLLPLDISEEEMQKIKQEELSEKILKNALSIYKRKEENVGNELMRRLERLALLQVIDERWKEHLYEVDQLKEGIGLRAYGQKDPLIEYKREAYNMFIEMLDRIDEQALEFIFKAQLRPEPARMPQQVREKHESTIGMGFEGRSKQPEAARPGKRTPVRVERKVGRNDPCPCGSGKKFKKCHGAGL